jgi:hypothetical protein
MAAKSVKPTEYVMDDGTPASLAPDTTIKPPTITRVPREFTPEIAAELKNALQVSGLPIKLYKVNFDNETYIIRPLMLRDWLEVQKFIQSNNGQLRQDQIDRKVVELGLVWPQEIIHPLRWEIQRAGLQKSLADQIMARSGFIVGDVDQSEFLKVEPLTTMETGPRPTPEVVEELKEQTDWPLKLVFLDGEYFVIRPLSRAEWTVLTKMGDGTDVDVATCEKVCVWSKEFPEKPSFDDRVGGCASTLSALTMQFSGFNSQPQIEEL